jgi:glycine cleavage system H protein
MSYPTDRKYTKEHEWAMASGDPVKVGVTDYAAKTLNDVVYVTLPKAGEHVSQFKTMGTVESIKAVSELYSPFSGVVTKVNEALNSHPELVNTSPYEEGWLIEIKPNAFGSESKTLLDSKGYTMHLESVTSQE